MSLFAIGDLHLSLSGAKPMEIFKGWENHVERLTNGWNTTVSDTDTVVVIGDLTWASGLDNADTDFRFINDRLNGEKIIIKGNHDYWWNTLSKLNTFFEANGFTRMKVLHNNAFKVENTVICGTRGWLNDDGKPADLKILKREALRLEESLKAGQKLDGELTAFVHYPPIYSGNENPYLLESLVKYNVKRCFYAHLHGAKVRGAFSGERYGINFSLCSADSVGFTPVLVDNF
ncbi:MAG: metallophosphoesterase [Oscillospiraceae bacterium]|nr:metallophosphoesterase [Oscillospiraceae bacterium]